MNRPGIKNMCERAPTAATPKRIGDNIEWVTRRTRGHAVTLDTHAGIIRAFRTVRQALCAEKTRLTWVDVDVTDESTDQNREI